MTVKYLRQAQLDLIGIRDWGDDHWGPARTNDFLRGLVEAIARLDGAPHYGRSRDDLLPGLRSIRHRGYVVFYRGEGDNILIGTILHERRNMAALDFADRMAGE